MPTTIPIIGEESQDSTKEWNANTREDLASEMAKHAHQGEHEHDDELTPGKGPIANRVPAEEFEILGRWAHDMNLKWVEVLKHVGITGTTAWRIPQGKAGLRTFKLVEAWLVEYAARVKGPKNPMQVYREWVDLGKRLAKDRPADFAKLLDSTKSVISMLPPAGAMPELIVVKKVGNAPAATPRKRRPSR